MLNVAENQMTIDELAQKTRPTSSSSSFMYINPLIGINQQFSKFRQLKPLNEDIPEETIRHKLKHSNNGRKKN
jgi:hypothetical protein